MAQIIDLDTSSDGELPVDFVLAQAGKKPLDSVVIIGWDANGDLYYNTTYADGPEVLWLLEVTKLHLLKNGSSIEP